MLSGKGARLLPLLYVASRWEEKNYTCFKKKVFSDVETIIELAPEYELMCVCERDFILHLLGNGLVGSP